MNGIADQTVLDVLGPDTGAFTLANLRSSPDCVKLLNLAGRISFMSENGLCAMQVGSEADVVGRAWWDLWPAQARAGLRDAFDRGVAGQISTFRGQCPTARGEMREWDVRISPIFDDAQKVTSVLVVSRDVTAVRSPQAAGS